MLIVGLVGLNFLLRVPIAGLSSGTIGRCGVISATSLLFLLACTFTATCVFFLATSCSPQMGCVLDLDIHIHDIQVAQVNNRTMHNITLELRNYHRLPFCSSGSRFTTFPVFLGCFLQDLAMVRRMHSEHKGTINYI